MDTLGWLSRHAADVPAGDDWLGPDERRVLAGIRLPRRRADWLLGRWTAKSAISAWLSVPPVRIQILAAADGAPEAWLDGRPLPLSVTLSHRGGRALAAVADAPALAGCDLELIEPRSDAFIREWLAPEEQRRAFDSGPDERASFANLVWSAKEAAAKVRREGLRLDVRNAVVSPADAGAGAGDWQPISVDWNDGAATTSGWWRAEPGWVMVLAGEPPSGPPQRLSSID
jgi:4'-phosphopantetheinyl transferase